MGIKLGGRFYLLSYPERPKYRIECVLLDANVVSSIYEWAVKPKKVNLSELFPILELIRNSQLVDILPGAIESGWGFADGKAIDSKSFNNIKVQDLIFKIIAIDSIIRAPRKIFKDWCSPERERSIDFLDQSDTSAAKLDKNDPDFRSMSSFISVEWLSFLTLLESLGQLSEDVDYEKRKSAYLHWLNELHKICPLRTYVLALAQIGFFGGTLESNFWDDEKGLSVSDKKISSSDVLKLSEVKIKGIGRVARNLAFDSWYFYRRNMFESGVIQLPNEKKLAKMRRMPSGILTGDKTMNAINARIQNRRRVGEGYLDAYEWKLPDDSLVISQSDLHFLRKLSVTKSRRPQELPDSDEIEVILKNKLDVHAKMDS